MAEMRRYIRIVESVTTPVVFHGSTTPISDLRHDPKGMFFTENKGSAEAYARGHHGSDEGEVIAARLHLRNPLMVTAEWLETFGAQHADTIEAARQESGSSLTFVEGFEDSETWARRLVFAEAHRLGHDSMIIERDLLPVEDFNGDWDYFTSYVAFDPNCIVVLGKEPIPAYE